MCNKWRCRAAGGVSRLMARLRKHLRRIIKMRIRACKSRAAAAMQTCPSTTSSYLRPARAPKSAATASQIEISINDCAASRARRGSMHERDRQQLRRNARRASACARRAIAPRSRTSSPARAVVTLSHQTVRSTIEAIIESSALSSTIGRN